MNNVAFKPQKLECIECNAPLYLNENDFDENRLIICPKCHYKHTTIECPHCDNYDLFDDFTGNPTSWTCKVCGEEVAFPADFYQNPFYFVEKDALPADALQIIAKEKRNNLLWIISVITLFVMSVVYVIIYSVTHR